MNLSFSDVDKELKKKLIKYSKLVYKKEYVAAYEGNLSIRTKQNLFWVTPKKSCKGKLTTKDLVLVDEKGNVIYSKNGNQPTSELIMHLGIYKQRPDIKAIIHSHPPYSIALTLSGISLENPDLPEILLVLGSVPTARYALTGTQEMLEAIEPHIKFNNILLSHHGLITMAETLEEAYYQLEEIEHCAKILCIAHQIGKIQTLPENRKTEIIERRNQAKNKY